MHYFRLAAEHVDRDPDRCLQELRKVLEGWAHLVCVVLDPTFRPYDRQDLRREPLAQALKRAREYLPAHRRDAVSVLKSLGDGAHHNQGHVQQTSRRIARASILQCGDLLEWMYTDVLREPVPVELHEPTVGGAVHTPVPSETPQARRAPPRALHDRKKKLFLVALLLGLLVGTIVAAFSERGADVKPEPTDSAADSVTAEPGSSPRATASTSAVTTATAAATVQGSTLPERDETRPDIDALRLVRRYEAAVATKNVEQILALHAFPATWWYQKRGASREYVRDLYVRWFAVEGRRRVSFERCKVVANAAVQCQLQHEPPYQSHPQGVPTCLVFDIEGRLQSRTEVDSKGSCPPLAQ